MSEDAKESKLSIIKILEQLSLDENVARMICDEPMLTNSLIPSINDLSVELKIALIEMVLKSHKNNSVQLKLFNIGKPKAKQLVFEQIDQRKTARFESGGDIQVAVRFRASRRSNRR